MVLDGTIVASLVGTGQSSDAIWTVELLEDLTPGERPVPFTDLEHRFGTLEEARLWLGAVES